MIDDDPSSKEPSPAPSAAAGAEAPAATPEIVALAPDDSEANPAVEATDSPTKTDGEVTPPLTNADVGEAAEGALIAVAPSPSATPTISVEPTPSGALPISVEPTPSGAPAILAASSFGRTTHYLASLLMLASLAMVLFNMQLSSRENANTGSRYATIESLVDYGTYNIDASRYLFTPDKVRARDHFVSSKPPLLPTYGAGVYWVLKKVGGWNIVDNEGIVVWTVGVFTGWLGHLIFLIYFYRLSRLVIEREFALMVTLAAACFAWLGVSYATAINNHSPGATLAVVGFFYAYRARHGSGKILDWVLAGLWLGILPAIDLSSAALTGFAGVYLITRDWKRTLLLYVPAALPGLVLEPLLAHAATGSWIPAYAETSFMHYAGSYFGGHRAGIDALMEPKSVYAFNVLLGHHGVFSMTPIFFFSIYEGVRRLVKRDKLTPEIILMLATFAVVTAFYIVRTHNYGGWCVGMRWLVPVMPWLVLLFGLWIDRVDRGRITWAFVLLAFAVSAFNVQDGLSSPFQFSMWHNFLENEPNRNRLGPRWNLSRPGEAAAKRRPRPPGRPRVRPPAVAPPPMPVVPIAPIAPAVSPPLPTKQAPPTKIAPVIPAPALTKPAPVKPVVPNPATTPAPVKPVAPVAPAAH
ncbi:MAG TPA: hypothetical protein VH142_06495 [Polyangiaceae bacterium]|jgi:hypothetical protein|nr:hypothetical protein [Polyangiaceae bacterium]